MAEAKQGAQKAKSKKQKVEDKPTNLEESVAEETNITEAAIDVAEQEQAVIAEKRSTEPVAEPEQHETATTAKAGKRSAKALKEEEEKRAKEERKAEAATKKSEEGTSKPPLRQRTAEDRLKARGKNFRKVYELIDRNKEYTLKEAVELAAKTSPVKFDATAELHINLSVDPRQADQNIRGNLVLPAGTGKASRVAVFADVDDAAKAKKAGADIAGSDELTALLEKGTINFDTLIATPAMMGKLGKYARLLGPKGLMPNPKSGTVTADVAKAVQEAKAGRVEYRVDSTGIVHLGFGKVSFGPDKLLQNLKAVLDNIKTAKPASIKGAYIKSIHVTTSMGPSIKVNVAEAS